MRRYCDSLSQIFGYTNDDVNSCIKQYFYSHSDSNLVRKLKVNLASDDQLKELTTSPMNTAVLFSSL